MKLEPLFLLAALLLPTGMGAIAALYLRPALLSVLGDLCGRAERADLWARLVTLTMMALPASLGLSRARYWGGADFVEVLRSLLVASMNGVLFIAGVVAFVMWRFSRPLPLAETGETEA